MCRLKYDHKRIIVCLCGVFFITAFIIRAALSGITYDEAFTYLAYVIPLDESFSLRTLMNIYYESLANNHWINTLLIALTVRLTGIHYSEFIIRIPALLFGCFYVFICSKEFLKNELNLMEYSLLMGCYYLNEFFSLARGYCQAAVLILCGLLLYRKYLKFEEKNYLLVLSLGFLLASAYANSVTLVICFALGCVIIYRLIRSKRLWSFIKRTFPILIVYAVFALAILKYHFKISAPGLPLYYAEKTTILGVISEYTGMVFAGPLTTVMSILLLILFPAGIIYLVAVKKFEKCDLSVSFIIYMVCIISMDAIFGRGGFTGRTLLPAFPLFVLGCSELFSKVYLSITEKKKAPLSIAIKALSVLFVLTLIVCFFTKIDLTRTSDWYEDYDIRDDYYYHPEDLPQYDHASIRFYEEKSIYYSENS